MAVASFGGHWVQLLRITRGLSDQFDITYCSTNPACATMTANSDFFSIKNFSRWDAYKIVPVFVKLFLHFLRHRPDAVISTGAAPGLAALLAAKALFIKTIWIDSIANVEKLSFSGRVARAFASRTYTQWETLKNKRTFYAGNVLKDDLNKS